MNLPEQDKLKIGQEVSQNVPTPIEPEHAVNKGYVDNLVGDIKPPVDETYTDVTALLADQNNQEQDYFYEVTDASGFSSISSGAAVLLYNASTPTGTESDYVIIWSEVPVTNNYHTSIDFSAGTIVLASSNGAATLQKNLDGRWAKLGGDTFSGEVFAPRFSETSLRKLKKNIKPFNLSALGLINGLDIVTFNRKDGSADNKIGIIADDSPDEFLNEEKNAVDLYKTIFVQAKAIQELTKRIEELEAKENG